VKKIDLTVVVNGEPTVVSAEPHAPLRAIVAKALAQTSNTGQPADQWELRNEAGVLLDLGQRLEDSGLVTGATLFLNLIAGVGGEAEPVSQFVDPAVSLAKFDQEVADFRTLEEEYRARGWFLLEAEFPQVVVLLGTPALRPPALVCGVRFDYTNYDAQPPSVALVDPFTGEPYIAERLPTALNRALPAQAVQLPGLPQGNLEMRGAQPLMQAASPADIPFLCIAGVREYHEHPGHSGDTWELHRASGAGRLVRLLEIIHRYGVEPIRGYGVNLVPQVGFDYGEPPE
jgi:Predicted metal binding domain/Protein of Unknown function (DUF2604)